MDKDFTVIEGLVSDFESGAPIDSVLADINSDEDLLWHWGSDHFSDTDEFFFLAHESDVFLVHEVIEDYFDRQHLLQLNYEDIQAFIASRIDSCVDSGSAAVHFCEVSKSIVSALGEERGQAGIGFVRMDITRTQSERFQKLLDEGYLFLPNQYFVIGEELMAEKYQKFIFDRLK